MSLNNKQIIIKFGKVGNSYVMHIEHPNVKDKTIDPKTFLNNLVIDWDSFPDKIKVL